MQEWAREQMIVRGVLNILASRQSDEHKKTPRVLNLTGNFSDPAGFSIWSLAMSDFGMRLAPHYHWR